MTDQTWQQRGFERGDDYHLQRGEWVIARCQVGGTIKYPLYRGREFFGIYPDAHEAALHADLTEAGQT